MSEMTEANEVVVENLPDDDPMRTIIAAEARSHTDALRRLSPEAGEEATDKPAPEGKSPATAQRDSKAKRPGVDTVLRQVEETIGKDAADVIRGLQTERQGRRREREQTQQDLESLREEIRALKQGPNAGAQAAGNNLLAGLTPQQWEVFQEMARQAGLVSKSELAAKESDTFVAQEVRSALEKHGERFGYLDDQGEFIPSEDSEREMQQVFDRIYDTARGLTAKDLFVLARHDEIVDELRQQLEEAKKTTQRDRRDEKVGMLKRATTERGSVSGVPTRTPPTYKRGVDTIESMVAKAMAEQLR